MEISRIPTQGFFYVGNGKVAMGGLGADIEQLFAPCYSLPSVMSLHMLDRTIIAHNHRIKGSACYVTDLEKDGQRIGQMTDFTHPELPVFIRCFSLDFPLTFSMESAFSTTNPNIQRNGMTLFLLEIPEGTTVFSKAKTDKETWCSLALSYGCKVHNWQITFPAGKSHLMFVGGTHGQFGTQSFANCIGLFEQMANADPKSILEQSLENWRNILSNIRVNTSVLQSIPDAEELIEAVAVALITQTSETGGVIAGAFYHLAYGRDMYGVFRGYMALGLYEYARRMICYLTDVYRQKGYLPNASGLGMSCSHRHENDEVEQTGYDLLEMLEFVLVTNDVAFLAERMDYVRYLMNAQVKHLVDGMLPFNGDETYIAGGIFPRSGIDHGSMEATALYIKSVRGMTALCRRHGLLTQDELDAHSIIAESAAWRFPYHFLDGQTVYINDPARAANAELPLHRHGVCLGCSRMTNLLRDDQGAFLCPDCYGKVSVPRCTERYSTDCAVWMTEFVDSNLLPARVVRAAVERSIASIRQSNYGQSNPHNTVGYEYGVILYTASNHLPKEQLGLYRDLLDELLKDRVQGAVWTEYYQGGNPSAACCPYRPWESAINLCGILKFAEALY